MQRDAERHEDWVPPPGLCSVHGPRPARHGTVEVGSHERRGVLMPGRTLAKRQEGSAARRSRRPHARSHRGSVARRPPCTMAQSHGGQRARWISRTEANVHGGSVARRLKCWMDRLLRARSCGGSAAQGPLVRRISCAKPRCPTARLPRATDARGPRRGGAERRGASVGRHPWGRDRLRESPRVASADRRHLLARDVDRRGAGGRIRPLRVHSPSSGDHERAPVQPRGHGTAVYASPVSPAQRTTTAGVRAAPRHRSGPQSPRRPRRLTSGRRHSPGARRNVAVRHGTASRLRSPRHNKPSPFVPTRQAFAVRRGKLSPFVAAR